MTQPKELEAAIKTAILPAIMSQTYIACQQLQMFLFMQNKRLNSEKKQKAKQANNIIKKTKRSLPLI